ncbi:MAG: hypothetical protein JNM93_07975 [Bacteriovoracaceae bacterium]|nr:hypothetical protein [Bacteriovoracaceae bacterium]
MFYLSRYFKFIINSGLNGVQFIFVLALALVLLHSSPWIEKQLKSTLESTKGNPYFNMLVDADVNPDEFRVKLNKLPEILNVYLSEKAALDKNINQKLGELSLDIPASLTEVNMYGLKVELSNKVTPAVFELIKEYIYKLVGKEKVVFTGIRNQSTVKNHVIDYLINYFMYAFSAAVYFTIVLSFMFTQKKIKYQAYLVESFQRKENVFLKTQIAGAITLGFLSTILHGYVKEYFDVKILAFAWAVIAVFCVTLMFLANVLNKNVHEV